MTRLTAALRAVAAWVLAWASDDDAYDEMMKDGCARAAEREAML